MVDAATAVRQLRENAHTFWRLNEKRFTSWWTKLGTDGRRQYILEYSVCMPLAKDDPHGLTHEGKREFAGGTLALAPELNVRELSEDPQKLLSIFKARAAHLDELRQLEQEHGHIMFQGDLEWQDLQYVQNLLNRGVLKRGTQRALYVTMGEKAGQMFVVKPGAIASVQGMIDNGAMVWADVADHTLTRQSIILQTLLVFADGYRQDILGRKDSKYLATSTGCLNCGSMTREDGGKLLLCNSCGMAAYCSRECQKADWKVHKPDCNTRRRQPDKTPNAGVSAGEGVANNQAASSKTAGAAEQDSLSESLSGKLSLSGDDV